MTPLMDEFFTTREISVLNKAIGLTQELIANPNNPMKLLHQMLAFQLAQRPLRTDLGRRQLRDEPVQSSVPQSQSQGIRISGSSTLAEFLHHIFELIHTFNTTGDIDYLEDSILLCEEMIAANYDHEHIQVVRALFDGLLRRRAQVVTVGPRAEPIEVLPCNSGVLTNPETVPASEPAGTVNSTASETMTQIRAPVTRFDPTRVINPPEAAIRLTERITASPDSTVVIIQERPVARLCSLLSLAKREQMTLLLKGPSTSHRFSSIALKQGTQLMSF